MEKIINQLRVLVFGNKTKDGHRFGAIDVPDVRDYVARSAPRVKLPNRLDLFEKSKKITENQHSCGKCTGIGINTLKVVVDMIEGNTTTKPLEKEQWGRQEMTGGSCAYGDKLQNALKVAKRYWKELGIPATEYRVVRDRSINNLKSWLVKGFPLYTGCRVRRYNGADNFAHAKRNNWIVELSQGYSVGGHCFNIFGFDTIAGIPVWVCHTDYGKYGDNDNGRFYIRQSDTKLMFSMYLIFDTRDDI